MRVTRLYVDRPLTAGTDLELNESAGRYIAQVLRLRVGHTLTLFNGDGRDFHARLDQCGRRGCRVHVGELLSTETPSSLRIHLGIGVSRGERMDFAMQKSVELGVTAITPLMTERGVVQLRPDRVAQRLAHWRGVITGACEQCGRSLLPQLHEPCTTADWVDRHHPGLLLYHQAGKTLPAQPDPSGTINLLIGPEGGLSEAERRLAERKGFVAVRMGPRVMRTETAPIAALAAIQTLWGDFR